MPSLEALRAQLLGLLNQPAGAFVRVINAVPQAVVNVLQAKVRAAADRILFDRQSVRPCDNQPQQPLIQQIQRSRLGDTSLKRASGSGPLVRRRR